jgi:hypothetical protein
VVAWGFPRGFSLGHMASVALNQTRAAGLRVLVGRMELVPFTGRSQLQNTDQTANQWIQQNQAAAGGLQLGHQATPFHRQQQLQQQGLSRMEQSLREEFRLYKQQQQQ